MSLNVEPHPHQFRTRNSPNEPLRTRSNPNENAVKSTSAIDVLPLRTVWLQVRVPTVRQRRLVAFIAGQRLHICGVMPLRSLFRAASYLIRAESTSTFACRVSLHHHNRL